jgi:hypothetical protein
MTTEEKTSKRGRKPLLNKEMIQMASKMILEGATDKAAMEMLGISHDTWYKWIEKGEKQRGDKESLYSEFADSLKKAKARLQYDCIHLIKTAAKSEWQAAAWILERRFSEDYAKKDRLDMNMTAVQIIDNIPSTPAAAEE